MNLHGNSNRIFAPGKETVTVDSPEKAYALWQQKRVKGRTLLLFDNYPHMRGRFNYQGEPRLERSNLVEFSIFNNVIRKIYFVVPDAAWDDFLRKDTTKVIKAIPEMKKGVSLYNLNGMPMVATTPSSLPHLSEQALVYINSGVFDPAEVQQLISQKEITSDITVIYQDNRK
ncbi:hypothetical protein GPEL0_01r5385 [Geoanaerobacter pelophilus]|uniref:Uncharacterized protein n=1 Tax=Geoanaerobacter pelophilus TaxID=60036 RepID=A0ABQ0MP58_9BACT|nr:hypothetical protein GPEL0_01r5385 [Geoanaerobacter pelophilus]